LCIYFMNGFELFYFGPKKISKQFIVNSAKEISFINKEVLEYTRK